MADILAAVLTDGLPLFGGDWVTGANFRNGSRAAVKPTSATRPLTHTNSRPLVALRWTTESCQKKTIWISWKRPDRDEK